MIVNADREFKIDTKCPHCGARQEVVSVKTFVIRVKAKEN